MIDTIDKFFVDHEDDRRDGYRDPAKPNRCLLVPIDDLIPPEGLIDAKELGLRCAVHKSTISRWMDQGMPAYMSGSRRYLFDYMQCCLWLSKRYRVTFWQQPLSISWRSYANACMPLRKQSPNIEWIQEVNPLKPKNKK